MHKLISQHTFRSLAVAIRSSQFSKGIPFGILWSSARTNAIVECVQFATSPGNASFCTDPGQEIKNRLNTKI